MSRRAPTPTAEQNAETVAALVPAPIGTAEWYAVNKVRAPWVRDIPNEPTKVFQKRGVHKPKPA